MKNIATSFALLLTTVATSTAQTTATNWTATDCNSTSHTLFTELDNGKVIVFAWVMPCGSCVNPSKTAYNVVQTYAATNPGKVLFYLADDLGDADCSTLSSWVTSNSIGNTANMTIFDNSGNMINENDFGGSGMPHVIVMGGTNHDIFFNKMNGAANDQIGIQTAIDAAIGTTSVASLNNEITFSVAPNPIKENVSVIYSKAIKKVTVTSLNGQVIKEEVYVRGMVNPTIDISKTASGIYVIKVTDIDGKTGIQKVVKQ